MQMHLVDIGARGGGFLLRKGRFQIGDARSRDPRIIFKRPGGLLHRRAELAFEIGNLRVQFLDAGMLRKQRPRLKRKLRPRRHHLLRNATDKIIIGDIGDVRRAAAPQHFADHRRLGLRIRFIGARLREIGVELSKLLAADRHIVGAGQKP